MSNTKTESRDHTFLKKFSSSIMLVVIALLVSCKKESENDKAMRLEDEMESAYCTNSSAGALVALSNYLSTLRVEESNHVDVLDFDIMRAKTHERLFLIHRKLGDTNQMQEHFDLAMRFLSKHNVRHGIPKPNPTYDELAAAIERSERGEDVRWKRE